MCPQDENLQEKEVVLTAYRYDSSQNHEKSETEKAVENATAKKQLETEKSQETDSAGQVQNQQDSKKIEDSTSIDGREHFGTTKTEQKNVFESDLLDSDKLSSDLIPDLNFTVDNHKEGKSSKFHKKEKDFH